MIAKADTGRTMLIIHKDTLTEKIDTHTRKSNNTFG